MTRNSIRLRLLLAAAATIIAVLLTCAFIISMIFERHLEARIQLELDKHFTQLVAVTEIADDGTVSQSRELADPRFELPLSGLYWQIDLDGVPVAKSRSLWDQQLAVPTPPKVMEEEPHIHELAGPDGQVLMSLEHPLTLSHQGKDTLFVATVGISRGEINQTVLSFARDVAPALVGLGLLLLLATWAQLSVGLKPLLTIESDVLRVRTGQSARVDESVADEVKPLATELNALLAANEQRTKEARQRAADLAHGLRTPLTVLGSIARTLAGDGKHGEAEKIRIQTEHMRQQVEWELSKALSSSDESREWLNLAAQVQRLTHVLRMAEQGQSAAWNIELPENVELFFTRNDLHEILGNLFENAQKWARGTIAVRLEGSALVIEDDGPGVDESEIAKITERGFSKKEGRENSGLGLSIVKQLTDKNGVVLTFGRSPLGGLRVELGVPKNKIRMNELT
jgi:signal transduction histidine kinase